MHPDVGAIRAAAKELLDERGVFDIDYYGWLNEADIDPEFVGYVMWVQSPPYDHDFMGWQNDIPPKTAPTKQEQRLMELGSDFFGLMKTGRHFIGHALMYQPHVPPMEVAATEFDFSEFAALVALVAALDRVRDFIITAILGAKTNERDQLERAYTKLQKSKFANNAEELRAGFGETQKARKARNKAAHGLATRPGHVQRDLIDRDRTAHDSQSWNKLDVANYRELMLEGRRTEDVERAKVEARARLLCESYVALIELGEVCFRTEYSFRLQKQRTTF